MRVTLNQALKIGLLTSASIAAMGSATSLAQTAAGLETVVVTAEKRSENILNVPSTISVVTGQSLQESQVQSISDLSALVPGFSVTPTGAPGQNNLVIRGVNVAGGVTSLVGVTIDDVPIGSSTARADGAGFQPDLMPYDLQRIEVLNGPQGTLYGSSAMGGMVRYILDDPSLDQFSGRVGGTVNYIDHSAGAGGGIRGEVEIPIVNGEFGVRASGFTQKYQGYLFNAGLNEQDFNSYTQSGGRFTALWEPAENISFKVSALFQNTNAAGMAGGSESATAGIPVDPRSLKPVYGAFVAYSAVPTPYTSRNQLYDLTANWSAGFADLVSITAWQQEQNNVAYDLTNGFVSWGPLVNSETGGANPGAVAPYFQDLASQKFTQEIRLLSPTGEKLEWMVGGYFTHENSINDQSVFAETSSGQKIAGLNPFFTNIDFDNHGFPSTYREFAFYTNDTYHFTDSLSLTAGARYSNSHQWTVGTQYGAIYGPAFIDLTNPAIRNEVVTNDTAFTWLVSPQWHIDQDSMLYARVATGYRAGGPTNAPATAVGAPISFKSDSIINYEAGYKGSFLENRVNLTADLFDIEWSDIQEIVSFDNFGFLSNGGTARSRGAELSVTYSLTDELRIGTAFSFDEANLTEAAPGIHGIDGARIPGGSKYTAALTLDYHHPLTTGITLLAGGDFRYASPIWLGGVSSDPVAYEQRQPHPLNLHLGVQFQAVELNLFARNLLNSEPSISRLAVPSTFFGVFDQLTYAPIQPRTIGLSADYSF